MASSGDPTREQPPRDEFPTSPSGVGIELTPPPPTVAEHEITQGAFAHLESAFESYRAADQQRDAYVVTSSTAVFDPLVVSTSVA